jgi:hypothetical protein
MLDAVRRYVEAGREALRQVPAEELARDLAAWSRRNRERLLATIRAEVKKQISRAGVATKDDIESLKRRVRKLESAAKGTPQRRSTSRSTSGKRGSPTA